MFEKRVYPSSALILMGKNIERSNFWVPVFFTKGSPFFHISNYHSWSESQSDIMPFKAKRMIPDTNYPLVNYYIYSGWWFEPLWKIWKSIGMIIPNIWEKKKMFQTTNQIFIEPCHFVLWFYPPKKKLTVAVHRLHWLYHHQVLQKPRHARRARKRLVHGVFPGGVHGCLMGIFDGI